MVNVYIFQSDVVWSSAAWEPFFNKASHVMRPIDCFRPEEDESLTVQSSPHVTQMLDYCLQLNIVSNEQVCETACACKRHTFLSLSKAVHA